MADVELATVNASGDLNGIQLGDVVAAKKVLTQDEVDAKDTTLDTKIDTEIAALDAKYATPDSIALVPQSSAPAHEEGLTFYDDNRKALSYYTDIDGITLNTAAEQVVRVINRSGSTIVNGTPVRVDGVDGATDLPTITPAQASSFEEAHVTGMTTHDIVDDAEGYVTILGIVGDVDVASIMETGQTMVTGQRMFLSATEAGKLTHTPPDIVATLGGFLSGIQGTEPGDFFCRTYGVQDFPTVLAYMNNTNADVLALTTTPQTLVDYNSSGNVVLPFDATLGTITANIDGIYDFNFVGNFGFNGTSQTRAIYIDVYNETDTASVFRFTGSIPRDADELGIAFTVPFSVSGETTYSVHISASANIDVTLEGVSYGITSKNVR